MDLPYVDLHQLLNPPAIVESYQSGIESRLVAANDLQANSWQCPASHKNNILKELTRPLEINFFSYGEMNYEFLTEPKNGPLVAARVYFKSENKPSEYKIVYLRSDGTLVIYYTDDGKSSSGSMTDWSKTAKVVCIKKDDGSHENQVVEAYKSYIRKQKLEEIKQELRKNRKWPVAMNTQMPAINRNTAKLRKKHLNLKPKVMQK